MYGHVYCNIGSLSRHIPKLLSKYFNNTDTDMLHQCKGELCVYKLIVAEKLVYFAQCVL